MEDVKLWMWVTCGWCGFTGCAAPIGESCPKCGHPLPDEPGRRDGERRG